MLSKYLFLTIITLLLASCASIGPSRLHMDRATYNNVVHKTEQEQLLLNIVRLRYLEISEYIQIGSLTASYSLNQSLYGSIDAVVRPGPANITTTLSPTVSYSDSPTITYIPLSNAEFAKSLMTPISMLNFLLCVHAGRFDYVALMELFFERLNEIDTNLLNRGGINYTTPQHDKYDEISNLLNQLYSNNQLELPVSVTFNKQLGLMLRFKPRAENSPSALRLKKLLTISPRSKEIIFLERILSEELSKKNGRLEEKDKSKPNNVVYVQLRSLLSALIWLGYSVRVPYRDIEAHLTRETFNPDGTCHNEKTRLRSIMTIYYSNSEPLQDVLVKVPFHGHWFYIKASDLVTKDTFAAIIRLFTLTSAVASTVNSTPVLTIPLQR